MSTFDQMEALSESAGESQEISNPSFDDIEAATETPKYEATENEGIEEQANDHAKQASSETGEDVEGRDEETGEVEEKKEEAAEELKMLKAALNDSEYDIPADANLTAVIDGVETPVSVQELLNNYSGKVAYDKKFQELGATRKEVEAAQAKQQHITETFMNNMKEGKVNEALMQIGELAGKDSYEFMKELREGFLQQNQALNSLSPEQREAYLAKEEAEYLRKQNESVVQQQEEKANLENLQSSLSKLQETHGVEDAELEQRWSQLLSLTEGNVDALLEKYNGPQGVVDALGTLTVNTRAYERCYDVLNEYKDIISPEESNEVVEKLVDSVLADKSITDDQLKSWLDEAYSSRKSSKKLSEKAAKSKKIVPKAKQKAEVDNYVDFDELDD